VLITAAGHAASSGLNDAGNWASIAAALFAFALLVAGFARWAWSLWTRAELDHGIHVDNRESFKTQFADSTEWRLGIYFRNGSSKPLTFKITRFTMHWDGKAFPLLAEATPLDLAPGQAHGWFRDPLAISHPINYPAVFCVEYELVYGRKGKEMCRCLSGTHEFTDYGATGESRFFAKDVRPSSDKRLPRRKRDQP